LKPRNINPTIIDLFILVGKAVDVRDNRGWESLHVAASLGQLYCLNLILEQGKNHLPGTLFYN